MLEPPCPGNIFQDQAALRLWAVYILGKPQSAAGLQSPPSLDVLIDQRTHVYLLAHAT